MQIAALIAFALLLTGCAGSNDLSGLVLARVNEEPITVGDLQDSFTASHQGHGAFLAGKGAIRAFLEKEVDKRLLLQEARRIGTDQEPDIQEARVALRRRRATEAFYKKQVDDKVDLSDSDIAAAYERHGLRFDTRHILVASREAAAAARTRVAAGEPFGEVARQVSLADSAAKGGDLGIVRWGVLNPVMEDRLWSMKKDEISEPFETDDGWNVLYVVERVEVERPKLEQVQAQIKARLVQRKKERLTRTLHRKLLDRAHAVTRPSVLIEAALAGAKVDPTDKTILAQAGGEQITLVEVLPLIDPDGLRKVPEALRERRIGRFLETELARRVAGAEAVAKGYGDRRDFRREIDGATDAAVLDRFLGNVVLPKGDVDDRAAEAYWAANPKEFTEPRAAKLHVLFFDTEDEANAAVAALRDGKDFRALARASKNPGVASAGGDLGWVSEGRLEPTLETVAFSLRDGEIGTAKIGDAWVVVRTEKMREPRLRPFAEVRDEAHERARRTRNQQTIKTWVGKLREASTVEVDDAAIDRAIASYEEMARERAREKYEGKERMKDAPKPEKTS